MNLYFLTALIFSIFLITLNKATEIERINFVDSSQNPCENFYKYACGKLPQEVNVSKENHSDVINYVFHQYHKRLAAGLESRRNIPKPESNLVYQKTRDYYESCREIDNFNVLEYFNILLSEDIELSCLKILHEKNTTIPNNWNWLSLLGKLQSYGFQNVLLQTSALEVNKTHSQLNIVQPINVDFTGLEQLDLESLEPEIKEKLVEFKLKLETLTKHASNEFILLSLNDLIANASDIEIDIKGYVKNLFGSQPSDQLEVRVNLNYLKSLDKLIAETPKKIVSYFMALKFSTYLRGQLPKSNESLACIIHMKISFSKAFELIYEEQYHRSSKMKADLVINKIFKALKSTFLAKLINKNFSDETLKYFEEKLLTLQIFVGYGLLNSTEDFHINYFKDLHVAKIESDSFYKNSLNAMEHRVRKNFETITAATSVKELTMGYNAHYNSIFLPSYLLQYPIYADNFSMPAQYTNIATIIADETFDAFYFPNLYYDAYGNLSTNNFTTEELDELNDLFECLQTIIYEAYLKEAGDASKNVIDAIDKENFFISFVQLKCTSDDINSHEKVQHFIEIIDDFFEVFKCPQKTNRRICN